MSNYEPMFLSWCKSFQQEVQEFESLITSNPDDIKLLKLELKLLKRRNG